MRSIDGTRRAKGAERELDVVIAACDLISERGLSELRMADVAERADMSVGNVTYYFPTKSELLVRAIRHSEELFHEEVRAALKCRRDPWQRLVTLVESACAIGERDQGWMLWFEVWAQAAVDAEVAATQRSLDGWWRETLAEVIAYGIVRGDFTTDDPARAVGMLSGLTDGLSVHLTLGDATLSRERVVDDVLLVAQHLLYPQST